MDKCYPLLKRLVGGIKRDMAAILMTMGGILIPLGFYLMIEASTTLYYYGQTGVVLGIIVWGLAIWKVQQDEKETKEQGQKLIEEIKRFKGRCQK